MQDFELLVLFVSRLLPKTFVMRLLKLSDCTCRQVNVKKCQKSWSRTKSKKELLFCYLLNLQVSAGTAHKVFNGATNYKRKKFLTYLLLLVEKFGFNSL